MDKWDGLAQAAKVDGFSLHAGVAANEKQRDKLERLCRYVTRPPVSEKRLELTVYDQVRYCLKTAFPLARTRFYSCTPFYFAAFRQTSGEGFFCSVILQRWIFA